MAAHPAQDSELAPECLEGPWRACPMNPTASPASFPVQFEVELLVPCSNQCVCKHVPGKEGLLWAQNSKRAEL